MALLTWFAKIYCLGSSQIILDAREVPFALTPEAVRLLCDRRQGLGADGMVLLMPSERADFGARIFNQDGAEVKAGVGPGHLALAFALFRHGYTDDFRFAIDGTSGIWTLTLQVDAKHDVEHIAVELGRGEIVDREPLLHRGIIVTIGSAPNSYCVIPVDDLQRQATRREPPRDYGNPVTVLAQVVDRSTVHLQLAAFDEYPLSDLAGAGAAAIVLKRLGLINDLIRVRLGELSFMVGMDDSGCISAMGTAVEICTGHLGQDFLERL